MTALRMDIKGGLSAWQLRRATELMAADIREDVSMNRLAQECGLSVRHFTRACCQSTGLPPHQWLLKQRVTEAMELIRNPQLSRAEIAASSGFSDQSHLSRVFRAKVGLSPKAWRRANRILGELKIGVIEIQVGGGGSRL